MTWDELQSTIYEPQLTNLSNFCHRLEHDTTPPLNLDLSLSLESNYFDSGCSGYSIPASESSCSSNNIPSLNLQTMEPVCDPRYCPTPQSFSRECSPAQSWISDSDSISQLNRDTPSTTLIADNELSYLFGPQCSERPSSSSTPYDAVSYAGTPTIQYGEWNIAATTSVLDNNNSLKDSSLFFLPESMKHDISSTPSTSKRRSKLSGNRISNLNESAILLKEIEMMDKLLEDSGHVQAIPTTEEKPEQISYDFTEKRRTSSWCFPKALVARRLAGEQCTRTMPVKLKRIWNKKSLSEQRTLERLSALKELDVRCEKEKESEKNKIKYNKMKAEFPCEEDGCKYVAKLRKHLNVHVRRVHDGEKSFQCPINNCEERFFLSSQLDRHFLTHGVTKKRKTESSLREKLPSYSLKMLYKKKKSILPILSISQFRMRGMIVCGSIPPPRVLFSYGMFNKICLFKVHLCIFIANKTYSLGLKS